MPRGLSIGVIDRGLGDLVEHHPLDRHLRLQVLDQVPRDRLALAVFVGREVQLGGVFQRRPQVFDDRLAAVGQLVGGLEPVVDIDVQALAGQVGDVADRGAHVVVARRGTSRSSWPSRVTPRRRGASPLRAFGYVIGDLLVKPHPLRSVPANLLKPTRAGQRCLNSGRGAGPITAAVGGAIGAGIGAATGAATRRCRRVRPSPRAA